MIMTAVAAYVMGAGAYFLAYVMAHWGDPTYFGYVAAEAFKGGLIWPYKIYAWLLYNAPII